MKTTSETYNDLLVMVYDCPPDDRHTMQFYCSPLGLVFLQGLVDGEGNSIFHTSSQFNPVGRLLGFPLYVVQQSGAPMYGIAFGDGAVSLKWQSMRPDSE